MLKCVVHADYVDEEILRPCSEHDDTDILFNARKLTEKCSLFGNHCYVRRAIVSCVARWCQPIWANTLDGSDTTWHKRKTVCVTVCLRSGCTLEVIRAPSIQLIQHFSYSHSQNECWQRKCYQLFRVRNTKIKILYFQKFSVIYVR